MTKIQITDPNTFEVVNYVKTDVFHDGTSMDSTKCDGVMYKEFECGTFYKREYQGPIRIAWYKHLMVGEDASDVINMAIDFAPSHSIIEGDEQEYNVHSIWLKSNITFRNFYLKSIGTDQIDVSVLCIGNDIDPDTLDESLIMASKYARKVYDRADNGQKETNIVIENVNIDGNRAAHTNLSATEKNGGRQGICIKGKVTRIKIKNCALQFCATDGLQIYSGLKNQNTDDSLFAAYDIEIDGLICEWNRRHGASGDSIKMMNIRNSRFYRNGRNINDAILEGEKGSTDESEKLYGNGFDLEGYGIGTNFQDIHFINSKFVENQNAGLLLYEPGNVIVLERSNIFFDHCQFDAGLDNTPNEYFALKISGLQNNIENGVYRYNLENGVYLFDNIVFDNCDIKGRILAKSIRNLIIRNCRQTYTDTTETRGNRGVLQNIKQAVIRNTQTERYLWDGKNYKVISDDILAKSLDYSFGTLNSGDRHTLLVDDILDAEHGDIVTVTLTTLNEYRFNEFTLTGMVHYPGNKVFVTLKNNSNHNELVDPGRLSVIVEKKLIVK